MTKSSTETMLKKLAARQLSQSMQGFTVPSPSKCKDYGTEYEQSGMPGWLKAILMASVIFMLILLVKLYPY